MLEKLGKLQGDLLGRGGGLELASSSKALFEEIRGMLVRARKLDNLATSEDQVRALVRRIASHEVPKVHQALLQQRLHEGAFCILGGVKNFHRDEAVPHLRRADGAWFDFSITVREGRGSVELLAYDFEIRLPPCHGAPFLRFDLNLPGHGNEARELRCHLHPGCDDILLPAPLMTPQEVLTLFLEGLSARRGRAPSRLEQQWYQETVSRFSLAR